VSPRATNRDALLAAAFRRFGPAEFTLADLTVAAWEADRRRWGMRGFETRFPDSKKVAVELFKKSATGFKRYVEPSGENRFRLNAAGLAAAKALTVKGGRPCRQSA